GNPVVLERAQGLRRQFGATGKAGHGEQQGSQPHANRRCDLHAVSPDFAAPTPCPSKASVCVSMTSGPSPSAPSARRQIGAPAAGNKVKPTSETTSRRGSSAAFSRPSACAEPKRCASNCGTPGTAWVNTTSRSAPPSHSTSRTHSGGSQG